MSRTLQHPDRFVRRHVGSGDENVRSMLEALGLSSLDALVAETVPASIRLDRALALPAAATEADALHELEALAAKNVKARSFLGQGYQTCLVPPVIQRNVLENPGWYTAYTPYQAEIAQGRLEALLNWQTVVSDLTGMALSNASLLDEGTAAAEAMTMLRAVNGKAGEAFFVDQACHPQTIDVVLGRARPLGIAVTVGDAKAATFEPGKYFGLLTAYPTTTGEVPDLAALTAKAHAAGAKVAVATDLLALTILVPPGELGADVVLGNAQRFGIPLGFGGPHAAFFATKSEWARSMPGRIIGMSKDARGKPALRMALQTREQHIRREKATSNICTAQVLLAVMSGFYAVWHGPDGLRAIGEHVHAMAGTLAAAAVKGGLTLVHERFFDTLALRGKDGAAIAAILHRAAGAKVNLRRLDDRTIGIALDEATTEAELHTLVGILGGAPAAELPAPIGALPAAARRTSKYLTHPVFSAHRSETEMLRYLRSLEAKDLSLTHSMIALGSCTMKLNATSQMFPVSWGALSNVHPFAPADQVQGWHELFKQLEGWLAEITGFHATSLQPNAGSQGEYAGLLVIRAYHEARGEAQRDVCLIPQSAHGTNPASAALAGLRVVVVKCDEKGNVDVADLKAKAKEHESKLCALMITYPSTHGVFEEAVREICEVVHAHGGQVYMDGANMNAQVGLCRPGDFGPDVCHLNLHKTFAIPHGGGGPGMGPICVAKHLAPFLPGHPLTKTGGEKGIHAISSGPWGSASILVIPWMYIRTLGPDGVAHATKLAILNANYVAKKLSAHYPLLYSGSHGRIAHECILDFRPLKKSAGIEVEDVAKRLMDYGFHAPTVSFPVAGTIMVEPTESEPRAELDRFIDALVRIRAEIAEVEAGALPRDDNPLVNAPHPPEAVMADEWKHAYGRERAAYPAPWVRTHKFWPSVARVDGVYGDRNLVCACPPIEAYAEH